MSTRLTGRRALAVGAVAVVVTSVLTGCSEFVRGFAGAVLRDQSVPSAPVEADDPTSHLQLSIDSLDVGECFDRDETSSRPTSAVYPLPCEEPHSWELFAELDLSESSFPVAEFPDDAYPGDEEVEEATYEVCFEAFEAYVGGAWEESPLDFAYYLPSERSWKYSDRLVLCVLGYDGASMTGSAEGSGRATS